MGAPRPNVSQHSLQYDCLYWVDSSHTGEISTQVACNAACVQVKRSCKQEGEICVCKQSRVGMGVCHHQPNIQ